MITISVLKNFSDLITFNYITLHNIDFVISKTYTHMLSTFYACKWKLEMCIIYKLEHYFFLGG